jgi:hypothetical protein
MPRREEIPFGSFEGLLATAVHAEDWWIRAAAGVEVTGSVPSWHDIDDYIASAAAAVRRPPPECADADWVRSRAPIALGLSPALTPHLEPLAVDFVASRVEDGTSIAYPFLCVNEMLGSSVGSAQ